MKNYFIQLIKCSRKYILKSYAPEFDGPIPRTTSEQIIRVKCYLPNSIAMAFESSFIIFG